MASGVTQQCWVDTWKVTISIWPTSLCCLSDQQPLWSLLEAYLKLHPIPSAVHYIWTEPPRVKCTIWDNVYAMVCVSVCLWVWMSFYVCGFLYVWCDVPLCVNMCFHVAMCLCVSACRYVPLWLADGLSWVWFFGHEQCGRCWDPLTGLTRAALLSELTCFLWL